MQKAVIVSAVRTPIGSFNGKLASFEAPKLGSLAIRAAMEKAGISKSDVQEVIMGNVVSANLGQAPARQASIHAGLPETVCATTLNKMCASGMKAVAYAAQTIMLGNNNCIIAGGFESMSNIPYYIPKARFGLRLGDGSIVDGMMRDGLTDAYNAQPMGWCSDQTSKNFGISREEQDQYAIRSYERAAKATKEGMFKNEIISVSIVDKKETTYMTEDEEYKNVKLEKIPTLKPVFNKDGTATAANASKISDGAAALVIMSEEKAKRAGLKPLARIVSFADAERAPQEFTIAPSDAITKALKLAQLNKSDISYYELNEAFASVPLANAKILDLDLEKVNIYGGAVALGHPIGASGARILATLISALKNNGKTYGVAGICNGGGGASAMIIENL